MAQRQRERRGMCWTRLYYYNTLVGPSKMRVTPIADRTGELSIAIY